MAPTLSSSTSRVRTNAKPQSFWQEQVAKLTSTVGEPPCPGREENPPCIVWKALAVSSSKCSRCNPTAPPVQNVRDAIRSYSAPKSSSNKFGEQTDEEIDAGFDFIVLDAPCSSSEMQQLRWMTKTLNNPQSPIFNWSGALVEKALRNLSQDGSLAKKEMDSPIPLTPTYYHDWVLELLEKVWDFDTSALLMLGEAGAGKSPLDRSILLAQARYNRAHLVYAQNRFSQRRAGQHHHGRLSG